MAETRLVVEHREQLWSLLVEAAQYEHMIMCQYLYACFSLRTAYAVTQHQRSSHYQAAGQVTGMLAAAAPPGH